MARLSKQDWIALGFRILSEFAQDKLKIQYLCEEMGVTRGSFYHHFESMDQYLTELMLAYEQLNTMTFIEAAAKLDEFEERIAVLDEMIFNANHRLEASIRSFAFYNAIVNTYMKRVDQIRLKFLADQYQKAGIEQEEAQQKAKWAYSTLIGIQMMEPDMSPEDMKELYKGYPLRL